VRDRRRDRARKTKREKTNSRKEDGGKETVKNRTRRGDGEDG
jgi:hypothetical protein